MNVPDIINLAKKGKPTKESKSLINSKEKIKSSKNGVWDIFLINTTFLNYNNFGNKR